MRVRLSTNSVFDTLSVSLKTLLTIKKGRKNKSIAGAKIIITTLYFRIKKYIGLKIHFSEQQKFSTSIVSFCFLCLCHRVSARCILSGAHVGIAGG